MKKTTLRALTAVALISLLLCFAIIGISAAGKSQRGDIDANGVIDTRDAVLLAQYLAKWDVTVDEYAADCNGDASANSLDAVLLAQYLAKWDVSFPDDSYNRENVYMLVATPTTVKNDNCTIPGAVMDGYIGKKVNAGYVAFAPIGEDNRAINDISKYVYIRVDNLDDSVKSNVGSYLGYAFELTFNDDDQLLSKMRQCKTRTFMNYGDILEISLNYMVFGSSSDNPAGYFEPFLTFGGVSYNLVARDNQETTLLLPVENLILYTDIGEKVYIEDSGDSDMAIIRQGDYFAANNSLGLEEERAIERIAKNNFCKITAIDYDDDGIYDSGIYTPMYLGYIGQIRDTDGNPNNGNEFSLTGISRADGSTSLLKNVHLNDYTFTGGISKPGSWAWYLYDYNRHTQTIKVNEVARAVYGKVEWASKGEINVYSNIYEDSQVCIGNYTYKIGGWHFNNLQGLNQVASFDTSQRNTLAAAMGISRYEITSTYYNGWNDVLEFGMTDACTGFKGYAIAGHIIHGVPTLKSSQKYGFVMFNAYQSEFAIENNQIIVNALVDTSGEVKKVKINSIDSMKFTDIEYLIFCHYMNVAYPDMDDAAKREYFFSDEMRKNVQSSAQYKEFERAYIINRLTNHAANIDGNEYADLLMMDASRTLIYAVNGVNSDGSYQLLTTKIPTVTLRTNPEIIHFTAGVSSQGLTLSSAYRPNSPISTTNETAFTFVTKDGIYKFIGIPAEDYSIILTSSTKIYAASEKEIFIVDTHRCIDEIAIGRTDITEWVKDIALTYNPVDHTVAEFIENDSELICDTILRSHNDTWELSPISEGAEYPISVYSGQGYFRAPEAEYKQIEVTAQEKTSYVIFNALQTKISTENDQIIFDAIIDGSGEYKTVKINSINGKKFNDVDYNTFIRYCDEYYSCLDNRTSIYSYYFDDQMRENYKATFSYYMLQRAYLTYILSNGSFDPYNTALLSVIAVNEDGSYDVSTDYSITGEQKVLGGTVQFDNGVSSRAFTISGKPITFHKDTVFVIAGMDGVYTYTGIPENIYCIELSAYTRIIRADSDAVIIVDTGRPVDEIAIGNVSWIESLLDIELSNYYIVAEHYDTWAFNEYLPYAPGRFNHYDEVYLVTEKTSNSKIYWSDGNLYFVYSNLYNLIERKYEPEVIFTNMEVPVFGDTVFYENGSQNVGTNYGTIIARGDGEVIVLTPDELKGGNAWNLFNSDIYQFGYYEGYVKDSAGKIVQVKIDGMVYTVKNVDITTVYEVKNANGYTLVNFIGKTCVAVGDFSHITRDAAIFFTYDPVTFTLTGYAFN